MTHSRAPLPNPFVNSLPGDIVLDADVAHVVGTSGLLALPQGPHIHKVTGYHHTDAAGFIGIVENNELWASSPMVMNDSREVRHGQKVLRRTWASMNRTVLDPAHVAFLDALLIPGRLVEVVLSSTYVLSVTAERDSLNQWQGYSGRQGYAIGLSLASYLNPRARPGTTIIHQQPIAFPGWYKVLYARIKQVEACQAVLEFLGSPLLRREGLSSDLYEVLATTLLGTLVLRLKHPAFKDEREYRYIASDVGSNADTHMVWWRAGPRGPVPYAKLVDRGTQNRDGQYAGSLPLQEVLSGPGADAASMVLTRRLLAAAGYDGVPVTKSRAPYTP